MTRTSPEQRAELERLVSGFAPLRLIRVGDETLADTLNKMLADLADVTAERDAARAEVAAVRARVEVLADDLVAMAENYPQDVFPGPQPEDDKYAVMHGASEMARHVYANVAPSMARAVLAAGGEGDA